MNELSSSLIEMEGAGNKDYLSLPTNDLLDAFGQGSHIPGSGSASALSGLIAVELMKTVVTLSLGREQYSEHASQFEFILNELNTRSKPKFTELFNADIQVFHKVSYHRRLRDTAKENTPEKSENAKLALDRLREATDIPIEICETSLVLMEYAFRIFDNGFKSARGDSGVAISNLLSAAQGALFVVFLNLKSFQKSKWKEDKMNEAVKLAQRFTKIQKEAYQRVVTLYNENTDNQQLTLDFYK
ncbi:cyclodeaminase/cyclohydrolase family protein [Algoriphagus chordae]|uniref:Formiminotetrahydrofolate cyclodeaminase n=1 Tax=Algoriphagus chordae TaxID=237019 RepID=A0A2W7QZX9_9BACT|nr:cyclodeaminase/cyclohydrolase family protein [Algoriphagus chordae]PZX52566.1 formiminotetrahydrofolate cyclodeaminase [Algoriphagus chordae]